MKAQESAGTRSGPWAKLDRRQKAPLRRFRCFSKTTRNRSAKPPPRPSGRLTPRGGPGLNNSAYPMLTRIGRLFVAQALEISATLLRRRWVQVLLLVLTSAVLSSIFLSLSKPHEKVQAVE